MSRFEKDFVINQVRVSQSKESSIPVNGVVRDVKVLPAKYVFPTSGSRLVDADLHRYKSSYLEGSESNGDEYLIWPSNNSNLALIDDDSWYKTDFECNIPVGLVTVVDTSSSDGFRYDGTTKVVVSDAGGRSIGKVLWIKAHKGDSTTEFTLNNIVDFTVLDPNSGVVYINNTVQTRTYLSPDAGEPAAFSLLRGDEITEVAYVVEPLKFWWTRNDRFKTRFGWNGSVQRWEPYKGSSPVSLGPLKTGGTYELNPKIGGLVSGEYLPGLLSEPDSYCMIRIGEVPDSSSIPVGRDNVGFDGVLVVDDQVMSNYDFSVLNPAAIVGRDRQTIIWNPAYVAINAGNNVWYINDDFITDATGDIGSLLSSDSNALFISPIPNIGERPFIRIGSRRYLVPLIVDNDADLAVLPVVSGAVGISRSTGKLKFSSGDVGKSDPYDPLFDVNWLDARVFYDGISMNEMPQPLKSPVILRGDGGNDEVIGESNNLYIPDADPLIGVGTSGIIHVPDGTGNDPIVGVPSVRPGGDNTSDVTTGLVRKVNGVGDCILFNKNGCIKNISMVNYGSEIPTKNRNIPSDTAYISKEMSYFGFMTAGSKVGLGKVFRSNNAGENLYFLQADLIPSRYIDKVRLISDKKGPFTFTGYEKLYISINGNNYDWKAPSGTHSSEQVAASIETDISAHGICYQSRGYIVIESLNKNAGSIEIGSSLNGTVDLSAASILGFVPYSRVDTTDSRTFWVQNSSISVGLFRSELNKDGLQPYSDYSLLSRKTDQVISNSVQQTPFSFIGDKPLVDIGGYDDGVHFKVVDGVKKNYLKNYIDIIYQFDSLRSQFSWVEFREDQFLIDRKVSTINMTGTNLVPSSFYPSVGGGILVSDGGVPVQYTYGEDYQVLSGGAPGSVILTRKFGAEVLSGYAGSYAGIIFSDPFLDPIAEGIQPGYLLKLLSDDSVRVVTSVPNHTQIVLDVGFPIPSTTPESWKIYEGLSDLVNDEAVLSDIVYNDFDHLDSEYIKINVLKLGGIVPEDSTEQLSSRRIVYDIQESYEKGRNVYIRVGLNPGNDLPVYFLKAESLGVISNGSLFVDVTDQRVVNGNFNIRVGNTAFANGGSLNGVVAFTTPIPAGNIEYLSSTGELGFAPDLLSSYQGSYVQYEEDFLDSSILTPSTVEINPYTGYTNFSDYTMSISNEGDFYVVEQMIVKNRVDAAVNPITGSFAFIKPITSGKMVEISYTVADSSGNMVMSGGSPLAITEKLPVVVTREAAVRVDSRKYSFNPTGRTIPSSTSIIVYVGIERQNYKTKNQVSYDLVNNTLLFSYDVSSSAVVSVNYPVYESFGGEISYNATRSPMYRPPFWIDAGASSFTLSGNRTDIVNGSIMRIGDTPFYVKSQSYSPTSGLTTVNIHPSFSRELGSRSPANDLISVMTNLPVPTVVDGVPMTSAKPGFFEVITTRYDVVNKDHRVIRFQGNLYNKMVPGKIIEVGGIPYIIASRKMSDDGGSTEIDITSSFVRQHTYGTDQVKLSMRPIYPNEAQNLIGVGEIYPNDEFEVILFGEEVLDDSGMIIDDLPGRVLENKKDYEIDLSNGNITLLGDNAARSGSKVQQKILFRGTRVESLEPQKEGRYVKYPRVVSRYLNVKTPQSGDEILGKKLLGTYSYVNPDSFYFKVEKLSDASSSVQDGVSQDLISGNRQKPVFLTSSSTENDEGGFTGLSYSISKGKTEERVGRAYINLYDSYISGMEQTLEAIEGMSIGDRDGRIKLFVGYDRDYSGPGYEDFISGEIVERLVWSEVFSSFVPSGSDDFLVFEGDPVVDPETATLSSGLVSGFYIKTDKFKKFMDNQKELIRNDMYDVLMVGRNRARSVFVSTSFPPRRKKISYGKYTYAFEPSRFSRFYPESVSGFTETLPGLNSDEELEDPGFYSYGRVIENDDGESEKVSSNGQSIATISNPVMGVISNVVDVMVSKRLPRARVISYSLTGYPGISAVPTLILSMVPVNQFPVDPVTGEPDTSKLRSMSASDDALYDIVTGNPDLNIPGFIEDTTIDSEDNFFDREPQQISWGKPSGRIIDIRSTGNVGVFVHEIIDGCYLTFRTPTGTITDASQVLSMLGGVFSQVTFETGDSIIITAPTSSSIALSDPPTNEELERARRGQGIYRVGFDVGLDKKNGELIDITLPSAEDPTFFALKELSGQNPPEPNTCIGYDIKLINSRTEPLEIPALLGEYKNDSGDESIPYLYNSESEKEMLYRASLEINNLKLDSPVPNSIYPDEFLVSDVEVSDPPAAMVTGTDLLPVHVDNSGIGQLRPYDLALVQITGDIDGGCQGIMNVGKVSSSGGNSIVEFPRFATRTRKGDRIRYSAQNIAIWDTNLADGMVIYEGGGNTVLYAPDTMYFNDGGIPTVGGFNNIVNNILVGGPNENVISIELINKAGVPAGAISISGDPTNTLGYGGTPYVYSGDFLTGIFNGFSAAPPLFGKYTITIPTTGFFNFAAAGGAAPGPVGPFNFRIHVYTHSPNFSGDPSYVGSNTGWVDEDRLTFHECLDFSLAYHRTAPRPCYLDIATVTGPGSEDITVNNMNNLNGSTEFTFVDRGDGSAPGRVGLFSSASISGAGDEDGTLKVMGIEGISNTSITTSDPITVSFVPSSNQQENGVICEGWGYCDGDNDDYEDRIYAPTVTDGDLENIKKGDLLVVKEAYSTGFAFPDALATTKAGTYLVRDVVIGDGLTPDDPKKMVLDSVAGSNIGWIPFNFPTIVNWDDGVSPSITVDSLLPFDLSPTGHAFPVSGKIYVIVDMSRINDVGISGTYTTSVISADYGSVNGITNTFESLSNFAMASGAGFTKSDFFNLVEVGQRVSGMFYFKVDMSNILDFTDNPVGTTLGGGNPIYYGLSNFAIVSGLISGSFADLLQFSNLTNTIKNVSGTVNTIVVTKKVKGDVWTYPLNDDESVYENVLGMVSVEELEEVLSWDVIHENIAAPYSLNCILPGEHLVAADASVSPYDSGFYAQPGIFLEPSIPKQVWNYSSGTERVVDSTRGLASSNVGMLKYFDFDPVFSFPVAETVKFEIRRIRRFHGEPVNEPIRKILSLYEIRDSSVTSYSPNNNGSCSVSVSDTQFGNLTSDLNRINSGDIFRVIDVNGNKVFESPILRITGLNSIVISITPQFDPSGYSCQIFLKKSPVPHEQSYEEITENIFTEIFKSAADYTMGEGGWVEFDGTYGDSINKLQDTEVTSFSSTGAEIGDILVIDPAGDLTVPGAPTPPERGTRQIGDYSAPTRIDGSYVAGYPSVLDDNRGVYKVTEVSGQYLIVDGNLPLSGDLNGSDVIFGDDSSNFFAVYPTVNDSQLTGGIEGQNDLRPTSYAVGGTFSTDYYSVAPFSYRILRPSPEISERASLFVLQSRERIKSWIDFLRTMPAMYDSYDDFQKNDYIEDVELGIVSNSVIGSVAGYIEIAPFANDSDCLSILDRRYWIMDMKLDYTMPPFTGVSYYSDFASDTGRPVYQDFVADILNNEENLRGSRMFWINYCLQKMMTRRSK